MSLQIRLNENESGLTKRLRNLDGFSGRLNVAKSFYIKIVYKNKTDVIEFKSMKEAQKKFERLAHAEYPLSGLKEIALYEGGKKVKSRNY